MTAVFLLTSRLLGYLIPFGSFFIAVSILCWWGIREKKRWQKTQTAAAEKIAIGSQGAEKEQD